jgi:soluble lytic murein transglycosylase-like protein
VARGRLVRDASAQGRRKLAAMGRSAIAPLISLSTWLAIVSACAGSSGPAPSAVTPAPPSSSAGSGTETTPTGATPAAPEPAIAAALPAPPADPIELTDAQLARARAVQRHVKEAAAAYDVDPNLINAIIWAESKFDPKAKNRSGARGLMQLMPGTSKAMAKALGRPNRPHDPAFAVHAGTYLYARLRDKFDGNEDLALFGYARGSGGVRAWQERGGPMPEGVQKFIARVRRAQATFRGMGLPDYQPSRDSSSATRFPAIISWVTTLG